MSVDSGPVPLKTKVGSSEATTTARPCRGGSNRWQSEGQRGTVRKEHRKMEFPPSSPRAREPSGSNTGVRGPESDTSSAVADLVEDRSCSDRDS